MASESGCPIEYHRIDVDECDPVFDKECQGNKYIPFRRADYDRRTGRSPNSPREQVIPCFPRLQSLLAGSGTLGSSGCSDLLYSFKFLSLFPTGLRDCF